MRRKSQGKMDSGDTRSPKMSSVDKVANSQSLAQQGLMLTGSDPGTDYGETPLTVGNITRSFTSLQSASVRVTTPSAMIYGYFPVDGFIRGWSSAIETNNSSDVTSALVNSSGRDDNLYPITPSAKIFSSNVWPVIENILSSGVGSRNPVSESAFVRHQARVLRIYCEVLSVKWLNYLTYHFDWTQVFPYSADAPAFLYKLCRESRCDDIDFVKYWIPILKRVETRTVFPDMVERIKRTLSPMMSSSLTGRIMIPISSLNFSIAQTDTLLEGLEADLTYLDVVLSREDATLRSFIPFTLAGSDPWKTMGIGFDVNRHTAFWNSGKRSRPAFTTASQIPEAGDLYDFKIDMIGDANENQYEPRFIEAVASRYPQVKWDEIRLATVYGLGGPISSPTYGRQLTLGRHGYVYFFGDGKFAEDSTGDYIFWPGQQTDPDDPTQNWFQFRRFFESKNMDNKARFGTKDPEYIYSNLPGTSFARMIHLDTEHLWMFQMLRFLTTATAGSALRDMRSSIADLIVAKANPPRE